MPALITHYLHSCDVYDKLTEKGIIINKDAMALGAQGPDFLYFHRVIPILQTGRSLRKIGLKLHDTNADELFGKFAEYILSKRDDNIAFSYALGFICHYSLDRLAHPYVYAMQNAIVAAEKIRHNPSLIHCRVEQNLDIIMLRHKRELNPTEFNPVNCVTNNPTLLKKQADEMEYVINSFYGENTADTKRLIVAFKDLRRNQKHLHDPYLYKRYFIRILEKLLFMPPYVSVFIRPIMEDSLWDYSNFQHDEWKNPYDLNADIRTDSFFDVFELSVADSVDMISKFIENINNGISKFEFTGNLSFKTGLVREKSNG